MKAELCVHGGCVFDREAQVNIPKERLSNVGDPTLFGTGSRGAGELGVEGNIITMGWHMVLEFSPSLVACCISSTNHNFEMTRRSQECVINVPATDLVKQGDRHRQLLWRGDGQIQSVRARARTILLRGRILTSNSASISSTGSSSAGGGAQKGSPLAYKITRICLIPLIASCNLNRTSMF
jgi:hypothetical protein